MLPPTFYLALIANVSELFPYPFLLEKAKRLVGCLVSRCKKVCISASIVSVEMCNIQLIAAITGVYKNEYSPAGPHASGW